MNNVNSILIFTSIMALLYQQSYCIIYFIINTSTKIEAQIKAPNPLLFNEEFSNYYKFKRNFTIL
jgi:hypothetical protein